MPLPKRPVLPSKSQSQPQSQSAAKKKSSIEDARFANFKTDPKFRLPSKKRSKTQLDERFSRLLTDPDFHTRASVDRYGRKIGKGRGKEELRRMYEVENVEGEESNEEGDEDEEEGLNLETESAKKMDRAVEREMKKVAIRGQKGRDIIREGAESSSSDESSSDEEEEVEEEVEERTELAQPGAEVPMGEVTTRLAAVNMDWDNIRASDIMAVANSFVPAGGRILSVVIYPSEFGMERLQREEIEGPPREIFAASSAKNKNNITSLDADGAEDEKDANSDLENGEEFDSKALRAYQLDRLRYYYAVITCSSLETAKSIYDNMDGREYLSSANFFDLRFVPDGTTFDEDPHDECEALPDGYKPNEFRTDALTHSKVKLTWDAEDTTRKEVQKRAFSRKEIDENELQAYIGSESESEEEQANPEKVAAMRAALGLDSSEGTKKSRSDKRDRDFQKPEGDLEITFSAGLSSNAPKGPVIEIEETTIEKYVRKQRERKQRRKERAKALAEGRDPDAKPEQEPQKTVADEDDPWNDPFFADGPNSAKEAKELKKAKKAKKREEQEKEEKDKAAQRANLELLMMGDEDEEMRHFDINEIMKAEKAKKKKGKKKTKGEAAPVEDNFKVDTQDPRFAELYENPDFAIDPTHPRFKATPGMNALLEEARKKRKHDRDDEPQREEQKKRKVTDQEPGGTEDLKKLAARVKAKSKLG
ncbi:uncharacterized protein EI97DRAFT_437939 [Westerdykella ornata]|uniref:Uncharacterized protein n=1 Tax=Westerdykella ornata TaxID=318751 RepID=A0A6A6J457_WESOR|nr:uncharacterized protein EI97DRAFT_437939 [Westerdykella ornata]KAF2271350.1 hypothetical protein EI97DRAFT_437939 [Westerdykella ornata]